MTHKMQQTLKALPLMVLYLLSTAQTTKGIVGFEIGELTTPGENFQFSTDILDDGNNVLSITVYDKFQEVLGQLIKIVSSDRPKDIKNTCYLPFKPAKDMGILPLRRLSNKTLLLTAYVSNSWKTDDLSLILVDTQNCKYESIHYGITEKRFIFTNKNSSNESFTLIAPNMAHCLSTHPWCRVNFNPYRQNYHAFEFDFSVYVLMEMKPVTATNGVLMVVRLINTVNNTLEVRMYDFSDNTTNPKRTNLMTVANWINSMRYFDLLTRYGMRDITGTGFTPFNYEMKYSELSFCWCARGNKSIHCSVFREDGNVDFNQTVVYSEPMFPWKVESIPNGLILFSLYSESTTHRQLRTVKVAVITRNVNSITKSPFKENSVQVKHLQYELACFQVVAWKTRVNEVDGSIEVEYMCLHKSSITNHLLYIQ